MLSYLEQACVLDEALLRCEARAGHKVCGFDRVLSLLKRKSQLVHKNVAVLADLQECVHDAQRWQQHRHAEQAVQIC
jgi:hypothetical protein